MSYEIKEKLDSAKDKLGELDYAYGNLRDGDGFRWTMNFNSLMNATSDFLTDNISDVLFAMDEAIDEIQRLDDENDELRERIEELEKQVSELEDK